MTEDLNFKDLQLYSLPNFKIVSFKVKIDLKVDLSLKKKGINIFIFAFLAACDLGFWRIQI